MGPYTPLNTGTPSFVANSPGNWLVTLNGNPSYVLVTTTVASVSLFVVPEYAIGALAALGVSFGALLVYKRKSLPNLHLKIHN